MTLQDVLEITKTLAVQYGQVLNDTAIKDVLSASLSEIHMSVKAPLAMWDSTADKEADENPIYFPEDCVEVIDIWLDGVQLKKHNLSKLTEVNYDNALATT